MLDATDKRLRQRELLLRISRALTANLDPSYVLNLVIEVAVDLLAGTSGLIALREEDGSMHVRAASHLPAEYWSAFDSLLAASPSDNYTLARRVREVAQTTGLALRQAIALPLVFQHTEVGIIYVFRAALNVGFTREEEELLTAFADQAAIAVSNARLYQSVLRDKQRLDAIIEQSADGVMILDNRWRITTFNRAMERLTGWPREEALGRPCAEVVGMRTPQGVNICLVDCPLQRNPPPEDPIVEGWIEARDGRRLYIQSRYSVQRGPRGEFIGAIANVRDITQQRIEEEMQNTFISVISHELKTPVSIIKGYAETLAREDVQWDMTTIREGLTIISEESDRLSGQIQSLLDASRLQAGGLRLEPTDWPVPPLVSELVERFAVQAGDMFTFELRFPDDFPLVHADRERVRSVLENLLSNAVKYSPDGGTIRIGGRVDRDRAVISVADQGIGVNASDQQKIFQRFYRADNRLRRQTQGAGLGLFLSRAIVEAHGGRMWVESQPGRGSRFLFTLPLATLQLPDFESDQHVTTDDRRPTTGSRRPTTDKLLTIDE
jgi:PAS domain S-box-containing protein